MRATIDSQNYDTDRAVLADVALLSYEDAGPAVLSLYAQGPSDWFVVWSPEDGDPYIEPLDADLSDWLALSGIEWGGLTPLDPA